MTTRKILTVFSAMALAVGLLFTLVHLAAAPDDSAISPLQRVVAALANFFGPWGVAIVRLVDFPNAGMRSFSWGLALGLTGLGAALVCLPLWIRRKPVQVTLTVVWAVFIAAWFLVGLSQIASGLL